MLFCLTTQLALSKRQLIESPYPSTAWSKGTIFASGFSLVMVLVIAVVITLVIRRRRSFQFRTRNSAAGLTWPPTPNFTPFASHNNSPMRPVSWEKGGTSGFSSRTASFYADILPSSPRVMESREIDTIREDNNSDIENGNDGDDEDERRSISPLMMSPYLARLPSARSGSSTRVSKLVRAREIDHGTSEMGWESFRGNRRKTVTSGVLSLYNDGEDSPPLKSDARLPIIDRRSALFSANEFTHLFKGRYSGLAPSRSTPEL